MRVQCKINLDKLISNVKKVSDKISKDKVMAVVKANAYGHGAKEVFTKLIDFGIKSFAVATLEEALELNDINSNVDILILSNLEENEYRLIENKNIIVTIYDEKTLKYIYENNLKNRIHIKLNTGMNRIGFRIDEVNKFLSYIDKINIEGIFTHLSSADSDDKYTKKQIEEFKNATKELKIKKHILNSAGYEKYNNEEDVILDYVRLGISMYEGVMSLYSKVKRVVKEPSVEYIGYNKNYKAKEGEYIATVSIGYADGYKRCLSNKAQVMINNKRYNVVGNICMDYMMVSVDENVKEEDEVILFNEKLSIKEIAKLAETIDYEIMTSISSRVKRIYK